MGCGQSKHDVAKGNTIRRKKSDVGSSSGKVIETIKETNAQVETPVQETSAKVDRQTSSSQVEQEEKLVAEKKQEENEEESKEMLGDNAGAVVADVVKATTESKEAKKLEENEETEKKHNVVEPPRPEPERLISKESPNHFFSSRKDEDLEGLASSEKSEYNSPRVGPPAGKETPFKLDDLMKETLVKEALKATENGTEEPVAVKAEEKEEKAIIEAPKVSNTIVDENNSQQDKREVSTTTEQKTL